MELPGTGQWKGLAAWLAPRTDIFFAHLTSRYMLFGEWCYARHSVEYDQLPSWFLGFDVYDKVSGRFFSSPRRDAWFQALRLDQVPRLGHGRFTIAGLGEFLSQSRLGDKPMEGLYLRSDQGDWLVQRAKLVRHDFIQSVEQHWSRSGIKPNRLLRKA